MIDAAYDRPAVVVAIIVRNGAVLLVHRRAIEGQLSWQFPGGEQELGEMPTDTAVREVEEELGLTVAPTLTIGERVHPVTGRRVVYVACEVVDGVERIVDVDELDDMRWCDVGDVERSLSAGVFQPVLQYLNKHSGA
jgi:8-oxo-dGTP diphosphatase